MATSSNIGTDPFGARDLLETSSGKVGMYRLDALEAGIEPQWFRPDGSLFVPGRSPPEFALSGRVES